MSYQKTFKAFETLFPMFKNDIADYFPYNIRLGSVRIRFKDGLNIIFSYKSSTDWMIQTYENHLNEKELKGENNE